MIITTKTITSSRWISEPPMGTTKAPSSQRRSKTTTSVSSVYRDIKTSAPPKTIPSRSSCSQVGHHSVVDQFTKLGTARLPKKRIFDILRRCTAHAQSVCQGNGDLGISSNGTGYRRFNIEPPQFCVITPIELCVKQLRIARYVAIVAIRTAATGGIHQFHSARSTLIAQRTRSICGARRTLGARCTRHCR